ncbi:pantoate--beta-alanine ligase [Sporothrix brasiliensis 5110]|uniref:Pantoate--beta-alanine ligase n=1 Tax=Sporothrix brasiliensis 5110 TaxID=1398154 RepID=A0A0C2F0J6_9PEZI|nr:pantoate--beta-alanine ligase [Sporothrix brasiliensis 5110]KIH92309.1 pantoate--beta-alanine ligase [Sporothrix brasiliensis 5110]
MFRSGVTTAARAATRSAPPIVDGMAVSVVGRGMATRKSGTWGLTTTPTRIQNAATIAGTAGKATRRFHATPTHSTAAAAPPAPAPATSPADDGQDTIPGTSIRVFRTVAGLRAWRRQQLLAGRSVGLVPTMGALHEGHLDLVRAAARDSDAVVVTIYVNPTQFGVHEDLGSYPRTWEADCRALAGLQATFQQGTSTSTSRGKIEAVFAPTTAEMYPSGPPSQEINGPGSFVTITPVGTVLEGASRPTFFRGVATVCMKLFHIVQPETAYFGQKDVQQTVVLRRMVRDFAIPLTLVVGPTVREPPDGLALSSRNVYLGTRRRAVANVLRRSLLAAEAAAATAATNTGGPRLTHDQILAAAHRVADETLAAQKQLPPHERALFEIDYLSLSDADTMEELAADQRIDPTRGAILSGAVRMLPVEDPQPGEDLGHSGGPLVRLIDNIIIQPTEEQ